MFGQHGGGGTNSGDETSAGFLVLEKCTKIIIKKTIKVKKQ